MGSIDRLQQTNKWLDDIDFSKYNGDNIDISELFDNIPTKSNDYKKLKSLQSIKDNSWSNLARELIGEINPLELYHGSNNKFNKFDLSKAGTHGLNYGLGAYLTDNPEVTKNYGNVLNKFFLNSSYNLANEDTVKRLVGIDDIPYFTMDGIASNINNIPKDRPNNSLREYYRNLKDLPEERYHKYLQSKGYVGYKNPYWGNANEYVIFNTDKLKPANTNIQRIMNRIPTKTLGKMATKLYNTTGIKQGINFVEKSSVPLMIYDGLSNPLGNEGNYNPNTGRFEIGVSN